MKAAEFKDWIKSIERMSRSQRDKLRERLEGRSGVDTILELIEQGQNDRAVNLCRITRSGHKIYPVLPIFVQGYVAILSFFKINHRIHTCVAASLEFFNNKFVQTNDKRQSRHDRHLAFNGFNLVPEPAHSSVNGPRDQYQYPEVRDDDTDQCVTTLAVEDHGNMQNCNEQKAYAIQTQQTQVPPGFKQVWLWKQAAANGDYYGYDQ